MPLTLSALILLVASAPIESEAATCPGFESGRANQSEADRFYVERALDVVRAAERNDTDHLRAVIADDARFEIRRGDYIPVSSFGPAGAVQMVKDVKPIQFEAQSVWTGPISVVPTACTWEVDLLFRTNQPLEGIRVKFSFRDGRLTSAVGDAVTLIKGEVR